MLDLLPAQTTKDARKSRELTETDLGMDGGSKVELSGPKKVGSAFLELSVSESGYGSTDDLDSSRSSKSTTLRPLFAAVATLPRPVPREAGLAVYEADDSLTTMLGAVTETKIITAVFELSGGGLGLLQEDVEAELGAWFRSSGSLVVASELVWSVPVSRRRPKAEMELKAALFDALRANNKRVLDLRWPKRRVLAPIALPEAATEEMSGRETGLAAYQGTHRRYYDALLPLAHGQTAPVHAEYYAFDKADLRPAPARFLYGAGRDVGELSSTTLVALNLTAITF